MSYNIFFDESGKIDRQNSEYSYYGCMGIAKLNSEKIKTKLSSLSDNRELHFQKFNLYSLDKYLEILNQVLKNASFNIYMVENKRALEVSDTLGLSATELRELLYIKTPERLIYGLLRKCRSYRNVNIFIDQCDEYNNYDIESKLKYQLNAQSYMVSYVSLS